MSKTLKQILLLLSIHIGRRRRYYSAAGSGDHPDPIRDQKADRPSTPL